MLKQELKTLAVCGESTLQIAQPARDKLLIEGISLRGHSLSLYDKTPFILRGKDSTESPFTKLWISDIPISCDDKDNLGCVPRSSLILEKMRNRDGKLKSFVTGRHLCSLMCLRHHWRRH